jgi:hypothetical protein
MGSSIEIKVVGLHKLPFDGQAFEEDMRSIADHDPKSQKALRVQFRANWDNAWIVVVEWNGPAAAVDFELFSCPRRGPDAQAAWEERILHSGVRRTQAAFFLHHVRPGQTLWYGDQRLRLPSVTPVEPRVLKRLSYCSPD